MTLLVTLPDLGTWVNGDNTSIGDDDQLAVAVVQLSSELVADTAKHPEWVDDETALSTIPREARRVALAVARRTYTNLDGVVQSGVGPLSERVLEEMAASMRLTDAEIALLEGLQGNGDGGSGYLFTQATRISAPRRRWGTVYVGTSEDDALHGELPWQIPYLDEDSAPAGNVAMTPPVSP